MGANIPPKIRRILTISIATGLLVGVLSFVFWPRQQDLRNIDHLIPHDATHQSVKIEAQVKQLTLDGTIILELTLESAQSTEFLNLNYDEVCLLEVDKDNPIIANNVTLVEKDEYSRRLYLEFKGIPETANELDLHIFGLLPEPINWQLEATQ